MPGPTKHDYGDAIGTLTQANYDILMELWNPATGPALKQRLFGFAEEQQVRDYLGGRGILVANDVKVVILDIETLTQKSWGNVSPQAQKFYLLVLPPAPRRYNPDEPHYVQLQRSAAAYYHAVNDSYGM